MPDQSEGGGIDTNSKTATSPNLVRKRSRARGTKGAKRIQFDDETWEAIQAVLRGSGDSFQELADEAFADLRSKKG